MIKETLMVGYHKYEFDNEGLTITMEKFRERDGNLMGDMTIVADPLKYVDLSNSHIVTQRLVKAEYAKYSSEPFFNLFFCFFRKGLLLYHELYFFFTMHILPSRST